MKINSNNYKNFTALILILVGISALVIYGISELFTKYSINIPWFIGTPSIMGVYAFLFYLFDKYLWKFKIFKKLGIVIGDDLNGKWVGIIKSSYDDFQKDIYAELNIVQTASSIKIHGKFNESKSVSVHENFGLSEMDNQTALYYFYRNEPQYDAIQTMAIHEGSVKLVHDPERKVLSGSYYSGRDRNNHGTIEVKLIE